MRVLMVSKALVVGAYQRKLEELAALPGIELSVAVPPSWRERGHEMRLTRSYTDGYRLLETPIRLNGHYHVHYYPELPRLLDTLRPDLLHIDEEPYNLATWLAVRAADRRGILSVFYAWQNILQRYPPPFRWLEADVLHRAALGIAGNKDGADVLRAKGYAGPIRVIRQFGIDPELFHPQPGPRIEGATFRVGFVCGPGRLIRYKGLHILIEALAGVAADWSLQVLGTGPAEAECRALAERLGVASRVQFRGLVPSTEMPAIVGGFDVLAGPSITGRRWKEQFGRMLIEAMACEVAVIGSDSGEIPEVVGSAGLVVAEGDVPAWRAALQGLSDDPGRRRSLGCAGRARVLGQFTQVAVAVATAAAYWEAYRGPRPAPGRGMPADRTVIAPDGASSAHADG